MKFCWLLMLSFPVFAFHKDFKIVNERAPFEFKAVFETLKTASTAPEDQARLIAYAERINSGLGALKKDQVFFLFKSEVHKALLEWKFPESKFNAGSHTLTRLRSTLSANQALYSPLSQWVIEALVADIDRYGKEGLLEISPNTVFNEARRQKLLQLQKTLRYTRGWIEMADTNSAVDFNALTLKLGWVILERIQRKSLLLNRHTTTAVADTKELTFNIPEGSTQRPTAKHIPEAAEVPSANETSQRLKTEAGEAVENIAVKPSEIPAEDMSGAIDRIDAGGENPSTPSPLE